MVTGQARSVSVMYWRRLYRYLGLRTWNCQLGKGGGGTFFIVILYQYIIIVLFPEPLDKKELSSRITDEKPLQPLENMTLPMHLNCIVKISIILSFNTRS